MALWRHDPFYRGSMWDPLRAVDQLFDSFFDDTMQLRLRDNAGQMKFGDEGDFTYRVNVGGYRPDELKVDIEGEDLVVQGEHKEQREGEYVHRQFLRKIHIPQGIEKESIRCDMDERGHLAIVGKKPQLEQSEKRQIPIGFRKGQEQQGQITNQ